MKELGHAFAFVYRESWHGLKAAGPPIEKVLLLPGVEKGADTVVRLTAGPIAADALDLGFEALGGLTAVIHAGRKQQLADAGLDADLLKQIEALLASGQVRVVVEQQPVP